MIRLAECLIRERIACGIDASSKKRALEKLSELLVQGDENLAVNDVLDSLFARERLGSTGIGYGMAIPHARLDGLDHVVAAFMRLQSGVDFDSADGEPVDLLLALAVPKDASDEHLQLLAEVATAFSQPTLRDQLRKAQTADDVYRLLDALRPTPHIHSAASR